MNNPVDQSPSPTKRIRAVDILMVIRQDREDEIAGERFPKDQTKGDNVHVAKELEETIRMISKTEVGEGKGGGLSGWIKIEQEYYDPTTRSDNTTYERDNKFPAKMTCEIGSPGKAGE